jgi:hypothetical protein
MEGEHARPRIVGLQPTGLTRGAEPMSPAERQARHRAKLPTSLIPTRREERVPDRRRARALPRPDRWAGAVAILVELQEEYRAWFDNLPANLEGSRLPTGQARGLKAHDKLQAITELDLEELQAIDPPRGYGRD